MSKIIKDVPCCWTWHEIWYFNFKLSNFLLFFLSTKPVHHGGIWQVFVHHHLFTHSFDFDESNIFYAYFLHQKGSVFSTSCCKLIVWYQNRLLKQLSRLINVIFMKKLIHNFLEIWPLTNLKNLKFLTYSQQTKGNFKNFIQFCS